MPSSSLKTSFGSVPARFGRMAGPRPQVRVIEPAAQRTQGSETAVHVAAAAALTST